MKGIQRNLKIVLTLEGPQEGPSLNLIAESWQGFNGSLRLMLAVNLCTRVKVPSHKMRNFSKKGGRAVLLLLFPFPSTPTFSLNQKGEMD